MYPADPFWTEFSGLLAIAAFVVIYWWAFSWWIRRPMESRGRRWFWLWWPSAMLAWGALLFGVHWQLTEKIVTALAVPFFMVNLPVILPLNFASQGLESVFGTPSRWLSGVILWLSWYAIIRIMERRERLKTPVSLSLSDSKVHP